MAPRSESILFLASSIEMKKAFKRRNLHLSHTFVVVNLITFRNLRIMTYSSHLWVSDMSKGNKFCEISIFT